MSDKINTPYSPYKIMHHMDRIIDLKSGNIPKPISAIIYPSALCNQNCGTWCAYRLPGYSSNQHFGEVDLETGLVNNNPNRIIKFEKLTEMLDDLVEMGVKACEFSGGGEPTVHPKHRELFQYTLDKGLDLSLVSNGINWKEGTHEILAKAKWVRVSVDCSNRETYMTTREAPASHWDKWQENISKLVAAKKSLGTDVLIGLGFVVHRLNWQELNDAVALFKSLGVDNVRISCLFHTDQLEYIKPFYEQAKVQANYCVEKYSDDNFKVNNLFADRAQDLIDGNPTFKVCAQQYFNLLLADNESMYRCCQTSFNDIGFLGSFKDRRVIELWNDPEIQKKLIEFNPSECNNCQFSNRNKLINYLLLDDPIHVNYV